MKLALLKLSPRLHWCLALAFAAACSLPSNAGYEAKLRKLHGTDINALVAEKGAPTRVLDLARGERTYVWERRSKLRTQERYVQQAGEHGEPGQLVKQGGTRIPLDCVTEIDADASGRILRTRSSGLACVAFGPEEQEEVGSPEAAPTTQDPPPASATDAPAPTSETATSEPVQSTATAPASVKGASAESTSAKGATRTTIKKTIPEGGPRKPKRP